MSMTGMLASHGFIVAETAANQEQAHLMALPGSAPNTYKVSLTAKGRAYLSQSHQQNLGLSGSQPIKMNQAQYAHLLEQIHALMHADGSDPGH
jgi:hypothetical protein